MNLWPRRIITGLGLILILALIVWGIVAAVRAIAGAFSAGPTPQSTPQSVVQSGALDTSGYTLKGGQEATADGLLTDGTTIDVPACLDRDITATAKASSVASGSAMPVTLTLENRGSVACSTSLTRFNLAVTTGDHQVYDSSRCADSQQSSTTLLLRPGATWSGTLRWDGSRGRRERGCGRHLQGRCHDGDARSRIDRRRRDACAHPRPPVGSAVGHPVGRAVGPLGASGRRAATSRRCRR